MRTTELRRALSRQRIEWPTLFALVGCYAVWCAATAFSQELGFFWWAAAAVAACFHASLQHEVLHGHPTRNAALNEALVFPALSVLYPYRRFKWMHLKHHNNPLLTDPYDDPESWYVAEGDHGHMGPVLRVLLDFNATFAGRLIIGPWLGFFGFARSDWRKIRAGDQKVLGQWLLHIPALAVVIAWLVWVGVPLWLYLVAVVWPAHALLAVRTYIEHRAEAAPEHRSAIVEAEWPFRLLFLNNSLHALHHERPSVPWYRLPRLYDAEREAAQMRNGGYVVKGYWSVLQAYLFKRREPVVHPYRRRSGG
ncbi:MAG: fatty acid desaturase [Pseudomonadota bacterium]